MKWTMFVIVFCLLLTTSVSTGYAVVWNSANQATVGWDAVTTLDDGGPIPAGNTIQYRVYSKTPAGVQTELGTASVPSYLFTLADGQKIFAGVRSERVVATVVEAFSAISWSDDAVVCKDGATFGLKYFKGPAGPKNLQ